VPRYAELKEEIERTVGQINGRFSQPGWVPVHYTFRELSREELLAHYRTAEIALITPLKDGMNLVAKEYCAASLEEERSVLVLSEFAGAVAELQCCVLAVNPYDIEGVADAIYRAATMPPEERGARMRSLRATIRRHNVFWWVDSFLRAGFARHLRDFPVLEDYMPPEPETDPA
jgi:trehalose 6-phosphate synthase